MLEKFRDYFIKLIWQKERQYDPNWLINEPRIYQQNPVPATIQGLMALGIALCVFIVTAFFMVFKDPVPEQDIKYHPVMWTFVAVLALMLSWFIAIAITNRLQFISRINLHDVFQGHFQNTEERIALTYTLAYRLPLLISVKVFVFTICLAETGKLPLGDKIYIIDPITSVLFFSLLFGDYFNEKEINHLYYEQFSNGLDRLLKKYATYLLSFLMILILWAFIRAVAETEAADPDFQRIVEWHKAVNTWIGNFLGVIVDVILMILNLIYLPALLLIYFLYFPYLKKRLLAGMSAPRDLQGKAQIHFKNTTLQHAESAE